MLKRDMQNHTDERLLLYTGRDSTDLKPKQRMILCLTLTDTESEDSELGEPYSTATALIKSFYSYTLYSIWKVTVFLKKV